MIESLINLDTGLDVATVLTSDRHRVDRGPADDFDHDAFRRFLDSVPDTWRLRCLGDDADLWQGRLPDISHAYADLEMELHQRGEIALRGNHDMALGLPERLIEGNMVLEHGHRADLLNSRFWWIGRAVTWAAGVCERHGWQLDEAYERWHHRWAAKAGEYWRKHTGRNPGTDYPAYTARILQKTGKLIIGFGHTHRPMLRQGHQGHVFANCGSWALAGNRSAIVCMPDRVMLIRETCRGI